MAVVVDPLRSSEARGKVGGLSYNTWRGRHTVKTCGIPRNQQTPARIEARRKLIYWSKRWQLLSAAQRRDWISYANAHLIPDWTGTPLRLTGQQCYVGLSVNQDRLGAAPSGNVPSTQAPNPLAAFSALFNPVLNQIDFTLTPFPELPNLYVDIWKAGPHSAGRNPTIRESKALTIAQAIPPSPMQYGMYAFDNADGAGTILWINTANARFVDGSLATANLNPSTFSKPLRSRNWLGAFPPSGTPLGFRIRTLCQGSLEGPTIEAPFMVRAGAPSGVDLLGGSQQPSTAGLAYLTWGGPTDLAGVVWTANDINHPLFGFQFTSTQTNPDPAAVDVDASFLDIYFTAPSPALFLPTVGTYTFHARLIDSNTGLTSPWLQAREVKP